MFVTSARIVLNVVYWLAATFFEHAYEERRGRFFQTILWAVTKHRPVLVRNVCRLNEA
ncbi:MAG TPA: hypothetical protein PK156_03025 [Polyangium sp.]|nr:hypothetical protein [Polyangium sp.]